MGDLELWRLLLPPAPEDELEDVARRPTAGLLAALGQLGRVSTRDRAPYLGWVRELCTHPEAPVRAGALAALAGVTGVEGWRAIVAGLDDAEGEVQEAALAALLASSRGQQQHERLLHGLFHQRPEHREACLAALPRGLAWVAAYLRADPRCRERALLIPLEHGLGFVFELHGRGLASDQELLRALVAHEPGSDPTLLRHGPRRGELEQDRALGWLAGGGAAGGCEWALESLGEDSLDRLIAALDGVLAGVDAELAERACAALEALCEAFVGRLVVALGLRGSAAGLSPRFAALLVKLEPQMLGWPRLSLELRRAAARGLGELERAPAPRPRLAEELLTSELVWPEPGALLLREAGAIARLLGPPQLTGLVALVGEAAILARVAAGELAGFAGLCCLGARAARDEPQSTITIADLIAAADPGSRPAMRAAAISVWVGSLEHRPRALALISTLARAELSACVVELLSAQVLGDGLATMSRGVAVMLAELLLDAFAEREQLPFVSALLTVEALPELGVQLLTRALRELDGSALTLLVAAASVEQLERLAIWVRDQLELPRHVEAALVKRMRKHEAPRVRAAAVLVPKAAVAAREREPGAMRELSQVAVSRIALSPVADLAFALEPALARPSRGLVAALGKRKDVARPLLEVCAALLAAGDPLAAVASRFEGYFDQGDPSFERELDVMMIELWRGNDELPAQGHGWLYRFDAHARRFGRWLLDEHGGLERGLEACVELASTTLRMRCFMAAAAVFALWRVDHSRGLGDDPLLSAGSPSLISTLVDLLDTELGPACAKMLLELRRRERFALDVDGLRRTILMRAPDLDLYTLHALSSWLVVDGFPRRERGARAWFIAARGDLIAKLQSTKELDFLAQACLSQTVAVVHEATLRLVELGEAGERVLVEQLTHEHQAPHVDALAHSVPLWSSEACVESLRALLVDPSRAASLRFALALALVERGEAEQLERALAIAREPVELAWMRARDWDRLAGHAPARDLAVALADSPHPHAFARALDWLLSQPEDDRGVDEALGRFLAQGSDRPVALRRRAAERLLAHGDDRGVPVLLAQLLDPAEPTPHFDWLAKLEPRLRAVVIEAVVAAALVGGPASCAEGRAMSMFDVRGLTYGSPIARLANDRALRRLFVEASDAKVRAKLARRASSPAWRASKLQGIAEIFAWGVHLGRQLTGRLFRVHMTKRREDFGYTLLDEDKIFVTPLPLFAGERHGAEIVEALILHELGHHIHHSGEEAGAIWKQAQAAGLHGVLNLVADEHLERNLRSRHAAYGDRLKRLAAHAFLHARRDLQWRWLLAVLGPAAFAVLTSAPTFVAHEPAHLQLDRGDLMQALEAGGSSWARFARALRMGLGDRWGDPRVAAGLALFRGKQFRGADMAELWRITQALAELFHDELPLSEVCGGHETLGETQREGQVARGGIDEAEVEDEVERILDPDWSERDEAEPAPQLPGGSRKLAINVGPSQRFGAITHVELVAPDPARHRALAREVRRHAMHLRTFLTDLGLGLAPRRARLHGRSFDRTRTQAVVLRQDPRMLVARELELRSDLFIGVVIDCSGSMSSLIDTAARFGVLIAEAVRGLAGVDARFWGFTDAVIYDAGDAQRCAVSSLSTSGGNNDAAALYHAANVAASSRRRAKLLVMISDGLPTQCTTTALRHLVNELTRRQGMICAQVAVRDLSEVCFAHYVSLADQPIEVATPQFGRLVSKLARRALAR